MKDMSDGRNLSGEARELISSYLRRRDGTQMVSTSDTIHYLRDRLPCLRATDRLLTDVVAGQAITLGLEVALSTTRGESALFDRWPRIVANSNTQW